jgi:hypothetical protein
MKMGTNDARCVFFFSSCFFIYSPIIYLLFRFYLCFEARVGLMETVGGSGNKNRHKWCIWHCKYVFFSSCFLIHMLTNDLILAQEGLMTTVGGVVPKTGTNDVSGRRRWCPNLSTSFFSSCFYNMPHLLLLRLKMGFGLVHAMQSNGPHYKCY